MANPPNGVTEFSFCLEAIACGKPTCRTCEGTRFTHGPYWYAYFTKPDGRTGKVYVGKDRDGWCRTHGVGSRGSTAPLPAPAPKTAKATGADVDCERMLKLPTPLLAAKLLGVKPGISRAALTASFRDAIRKAHPDKGGSHLRAAALNAAFAMLRPLTK